MIRDNFLAFDDFVTNGVPAFTEDDLVERFGALDQIAMQAVVDNQTGSGAGTITVTLQHSADGQAWELRSPMAEINAVSVALNSVTATYGTVADTLPTLPLVRAKIAIGSSLTRARVRLYVVLRDIAD